MLRLTFLISFLGTLSQVSAQTHNLSLTLTDSIVIETASTPVSYRSALVEVRDERIIVSNPYLWDGGGYASVHDLGGKERFLYANKWGPFYNTIDAKAQRRFAEQDSGLYMPFLHEDLVGFFNWDELGYKFEFYTHDGRHHHQLRTKRPQEQQSAFPEVDLPYVYGIMPGPDVLPYTYNDGLLFASSPSFESEDDSTQLPGVSQFLGNSFCWHPLKDTTKASFCFQSDVDFAEIGYRTDSTYTFYHGWHAALVGDQLYYINSVIPHLYRIDLKKNRRVRLAEFTDVLDPRKNRGDLGINDNTCGLPSRPPTTLTFIPSMAEIPGVGIALIVVNLDENEIDPSVRWQNAKRTLLVFDYEGKRLHQDEYFGYHTLVSGHTTQNELWVYPRLTQTYSGQPVIRRYSVRTTR